MLAKATAKEEDVESLQYKIQPWEECFELMLAPRTAASSKELRGSNGSKSKPQEDERKRLAAEKEKQPLVVVASLLDKLPNLG